METHIRVAGVLNLIFGGAMLVTIAALCATGRIEAIIDFRHGFDVFIAATPIWNLIWTAILFYMLLLAVPACIAGVLLLRLSDSGRDAATLIEGFSLMAFPIGTLIGGYSLWVLLSPETEMLFTYRTARTETVAGRNQ